MQSSAHDGSLAPMRSDIAFLKRREQKQTSHSKMMRKDLEKQAQVLETIMEFLDGTHIYKNGKKLTFIKITLAMSEESDDAQ